MRLLRLTVVLTLLVALAPAAIADDGATLIYLERDGQERYRPVVNNNGQVGLLANINSYSPPEVSPNGARVAFSGAVGDESLGRYAIFLVGSAGGSVTRLTDGAHAEFDPTWSPDGSSIIASQNTSGTLTAATCCRLIRIDVNTGNVTAVTSALGAIRPHYAPNGNFVAFERHNGMYRVSPSGGSMKLLAAGGREPSVSPNSDRIAYLASSGGRNYINWVPANGGSARALYSTTARIESPTWKGNRIYFVEYSGLGWDGRKSVHIRSIRASGGGLQTHRSFGNGKIVGLDAVPGNDELFFYRNDGLFRFYQVAANGSLPSPMLAGDGYTTGWDSISAVDLDADGQDEMFFYREDGLFRYYNVQPNGHLPKPMLAGSGYTRGWDAITAIDIDGDGQDEMFFYRNDGLFRFYHVTATGHLPAPLQAGSGYTKGWDAITAVDINGDGRDEMFFYRNDGLFRFYRVGFDGRIGQPIAQGSNYPKNWTSITAVDLDGDGQDEMFFYRANNGTFAYHNVNASGQIGQPMLSGDGYTTGWDTITSINLGPG